MKNKLSIELTAIKSLTKKDLRYYFANPLGFGIILLFIIILSFLFFGLFGYLRIQSADLGLLFTAVGYSFVVVIGATSMSSISREKLNGTLETLITRPIKLRNIILSKFLSQVFFISIFLACTLPIIIITSFFVEIPLDIGIILSQYIGAFLLGCAFASIGIASSSFFKSEITSLLVTLILSLFFIIIGTGIMKIFPLGIDSFLSKLSLLTQYQSIIQGALDIKDVIYFVAFISVFLSIAYLFLVKEKFPPKHPVIKSTNIAIVIIICIAVLTANLGYLVNFRIDLTRDQVFSLSKPTMQILRDIDDLLSIRLYASNNIPIQLQNQLNSVEKWLRDFQSQNTKIKLDILKEDMSQTFLERAQADGIQPSGVRVEESATQVSAAIIFGINLKYKDNIESINLLENPEKLVDFEYTLTTKIYNLVTETKPKIAFGINNSFLNLNQSLQIIKREIEPLFEIIEIDLLEEEIDLASDIKLLVIFAGDTNISQNSIREIQEFFQNGGKIFYAVQGHTLFNIQREVTTLPTENNANVTDIFGKYGIEISKNMLFDSESFLKYPSQVNIFDFEMLDYYFGAEFLVANSEISLLRGINNIFTLWSSAIKYDLTKVNNNNITLTPILKTSKSAGEIPINEYLQISQTNQNPKPGNSEFTTGVYISNKNGGEAIIISDSDFLEDNTLVFFSNIDQLEQRSTRESRRVSSNIAFFLNSLTFLTNEVDIGSIKTKNRSYPLIKNSGLYSSTVTTLGIGIPIATTIALGFLILSRKRNLSKRVFSIKDYE